MSPQPQEDWQHSLEKLETEISTSSMVVKSQEIINASDINFSSAYSHIVKLITWFMSLPLVVKLVVTSAVLLLGFAMLQAVLKLIASVISLALLAILVYLGYKFFVPSSSQIKQ